MKKAPRSVRSVGPWAGSTGGSVQRGNEAVQGPGLEDRASLLEGKLISLLPHQHLSHHPLGHSQRTQHKTTHRRAHHGATQGCSCVLKTVEAVDRHARFLSEVVAEKRSLLVIYHYYYR